MSEIVNGNPINNTDPKVLHNYSTFPLKEMFLDTHRFGEYHPHLVIDGVSRDKQPWRCVHDTRSYTLKAPLMQDIQMHKDYFMVNMRSILPLQAERIQKNPKTGDDVPADSYTSVSDFISKVWYVIGSFDSLITDPNVLSSTPNVVASTIFKKFILMEAIFSRGSLLASLGCNLTSNLLCFNSGDGKDYDIDDSFDQLIGVFASIVSANSYGYIPVDIDGDTYRIVITPSRITFGSGPQISIREFLQRIRDTSDWDFLSNFDTTDASTLLNFFNAWSFIINNTNDMPVDTASLWAYHLSCAQYFTDDTVDYIYSADLFRQYIFYLYRYIISATLGASAFSNSLVFTYNGIVLYYDYLSSHFFNTLCGISYSNISAAARVPFLQYFLTLFGYHRSLRYRDYFTGSRTRPLAIPSTGAPVDVPVDSGNTVSVINITRSIQAQRFLNAVNAARSDWEGYMSAIFGETPQKDMHEPLHLAHTSDSLFASEVENTGADQWSRQNSVTAVFRGNSGNYEFTAKVKEPCIIIGVTSYDIERAYPDMVRRSFFIKDRFDMFLPQMQYIGDQPVYQHELYGGYPAAFGSAFGYQFHDMHYKQLVNRCAGAFNSDKLPGYAFLMSRPFLGNNSLVVSPDFIRSKNCELDDFYLQLTSYSLGNYFHFICRQINICKAERPMTRKPQIL